MKALLIKAAKLAKKIIKAIFPASWIKAVMNTIYHWKARKLAAVVKEKQQKGFKPVLPEGVNLIASITGDSGLGQSSRLIANVLEHSDIPHVIYNYVYSYSLKMEDTTYADRISTELPYDINLVHINPRELGPALFRLPKSIWSSQYNIAFWLWELEDFPEEWAVYTDLFDEIWTPAEFVSNAVRTAAKCPVHTLPYHVTAPTEDQYDRAWFGLPEDKFLFAFMYDANSVADRKNPMAVVKAFMKAFSPEDTGVGLVIKANNGKTEDIEKLRQQMKGYENLYFVTDNLKKTAVNSLLKCVDVFVSLHRAEGFGLGMAESMMVGTPSIATNWSANTEFMNSEVGCMVDYKLIRLERDIEPYHKGSRWADADVDQAAEYMKKLYGEPEYYRGLSEKGYAYINKKLGLEESVARLEAQVKRIGDR
ncbi:MAG: glycosyltransferase family 4 protein [Lachnospiraceae bacterium]|nr:glycosyltransferase family 4 protein [Lachnospiraceae bacterium]